MRRAHRAPGGQFLGAEGLVQVVGLPLLDAAVDQGAADVRAAQLLLRLALAGQVAHRDQEAWQRLAGGGGRAEDNFAPKGRAVPAPPPAGVLERAFGAGVPQLVLRLAGGPVGGVEQLGVGLAHDFRRPVGVDLFGRFVPGGHAAGYV
jgi:hypothetical protein